MDTEIQCRSFCAIIFVGAGSTWCYDEDPVKAAKTAAKLCKKDWGRYFVFDGKQKVDAVVIDMTERNGWYASMGEIRDSDTHERIPVHQLVEVML